jgi:hypothetical protein
MLANEPAHHLRVPRIGVVDDGGLERQRRPERGRVAVGMEERQHAERHVGGRQMEQVVDRADVGADVLLRQHDALRVAGRSRGEDHGEHVVGPDAVEPEHSFEHGQRGHGGVQEGQRLVECRGPLLQVAGIEQPAAEVEADAGEEHRAGDHMPEPGPFDT